MRFTVAFFSKYVVQSSPLVVCLIDRGEKPHPEMARFDACVHAISDAK
jgi:hypothetical protein